MIPLLARIQRYRLAALAGRSISLPGPTGEDNRIRFVPRGTVAGVAAGMAGLLHQIAAALASGNRIVLADSELAQRLHSALPELPARSVSLAADPLATPLSVLLFDGDGDEADPLRRRLAAREGPIVPLLMPEHDYDLTRLVHERTVSINTAAAGGNASLMTIGN